MSQKSRNNLLLVGNDRISKYLLSRLKQTDNLIICIDKSYTPFRICRLILKGVLSLSLIFKVVTAEIQRKKYKCANYPIIKSNNDLIKVIQRFDISHVYLFRASLIINKKVMKLGLNIFNIHCASINKYKGLGAIHRALNNKDLSQEATMHQVTEKIDEGKVLAVCPYSLDANLSYKHNEDLAYAAVIKLLLTELSKANVFSNPYSLNYPPELSGGG